LTVLAAAGAAFLTVAGALAAAMGAFFTVPGAAFLTVPTAFLTVPLTVPATFDFVVLATTLKDFEELAAAVELGMLTLCPKKLLEVTLTLETREEAIVMQLKRSDFLMRPNKVSSLHKIPYKLQQLLFQDFFSFSKCLLVPFQQPHQDTRWDKTAVYKAAVCEQLQSGSPYS
jgi:hypothetical protein